MEDSIPQHSFQLQRNALRSASSWFNSFQFALIVIKAMIIMLCVIFATLCISGAIASKHTIHSWINAVENGEFDQTNDGINIVIKND